MALFGNHLRGQALHRVVKVKVRLAALGHGQLLHKALEHHRARVRQRVDRMAHAVHKALMVKGLFIYNFADVGAHFVLIGHVGNMGADIVHHLHDLDVRTAVLGALQAGKRRCNDRVGIRPRRSDHAGGESGVIAAAVLHVQQKSNIQNMGFQRGILLVGAQHLQQVFCRRKLRPRAVDVHAAVIQVVIIGMVAIHRQHGEDTDQLDALLHLGLQAVIPHRIIIRSQGQHAAGQAVHQILAGGFHDNVPHKVAGQGTAFGQAVGKFMQLLFIGQITKQQQVGNFLKAIALAAQTTDQVIHVIPAVPQLAIAGGFNAVTHFKRINAGNIGNPGQHTVAVLIAQAALYTELIKQVRINGIVMHTQFCKQLGFFFDCRILAHGLSSFYF